MKASLLLLTILGMIAINVVTGRLIEDLHREGPISGSSISDVNTPSRQKRSIIPLGTNGKNQQLKKFFVLNKNIMDIFIIEYNLFVV